MIQQDIGNKSIYNLSLLSDKILMQPGHTLHMDGLSKALKSLSMGSTTTPLHNPGTLLICTQSCFVTLDGFCHFLSSVKLIPIFFKSLSKI